MGLPLLLPSACRLRFPSAIPLPVSAFAGPADAIFCNGLETVHRDDRPRLQYMRHVPEQSGKCGTGREAIGPVIYLYRRLFEVALATGQTVTVDAAINLSKVLSDRAASLGLESQSEGQQETGG